jgi:predicted amidohydrolase
VRVAAVQLNSNGDKQRNLAAAERLVRQSAAGGAEFVALPEKWNLLAGGEELIAGAEPLDGPSLTAARDWARELGVHLLAGSICERAAAGERAWNTSVLIGPGGEDLAVYRKIHMFDVDAGGVSYRESEHERPGAEPVTAPVGELTLGMTASSPSLLPSPSPPAATTGKCCCGRGRSRTRSSSSPRTSRAKRRPTTAPSAAR